jgi:hypothetical protein
MCGFRKPFPDEAPPELRINTTSRSHNWTQGLSPFFLGPVDLYGIYVAQNVENGWQYSKVYPEYADASGNPTEDYWTWAVYGWNLKKAMRYPAGKGKKPLYSWWDGEKLPYVEARKKIYAPLYANAVEKTDAWKKLKELYEKHGQIWLWDFDSYDYIKLGMALKDVINCETRKCGHAFILAMMLQNERVWHVRHDS